MIPRIGCILVAGIASIARVIQAAVGASVQSGDETAIGCIEVSCIGGGSTSTQVGGSSAIDRGPIVGEAGRDGLRIQAARRDQRHGAGNYDDPTCTERSCHLSH